MPSATAIRTRLFTGVSEARRRQLLTLAVAVAAAAFPLVHDNDADIDAAANAAAYATLALGLNIVVGFAGLLDLGYAAFFAIGAYTYGILTSFQVMPAWSPFWEPFAWLDLVQRMPQPGGDVVHFTVSFWIMLPVSALIAAGFGLLFGTPTLRLRGDYLAIVTLGFGEIVPIVVRNVDSVTNGAAGLNGIQAPQIAGHSFGVAAWPYYYVGIAMVALLIFVSVRLRDSRIGRAWMAIRDDETAAMAMGVDRTRTKLLAFATGAAFAGATGTFYVAKLQTATPEMFGFPVSVMILVMVVLGGMGSVRGVVLGAVLLQLLQSWFLQDLSEWLHSLGVVVHSDWMQQIDLTQSIELIFGLILVFMMLFRRDGLIPATRRQPSLSFEAQQAEVRRGGLAALSGLTDLGHAGLEVTGLTVRFGGLIALSSIDLTVPAGNVVAVIGPNGSGKSTLFNVITGLVHANTGKVRFNGENILGLAPHWILHRGIARTFQNIRLFNNLSVLDNVLVGQHTRMKTGPIAAVFRPPSTRREEVAARAWATEIIAMFGNRLLPRASQTVSHLSYARLPQFDGKSVALSAL
jgi:branched-chain amino acid transport system permease protein